MRHPLDPTAQHEAAAALGKSEADGALPPGEADAAMRVIINAAYANAPAVDRRGLQMRLAWSARDAMADRRRQRDNAATAIRWAVRPLIQSGSGKGDIEAAAAQANGDVLPWAEIVPILKAEWIAAHNKRRRG